MIVCGKKKKIAGLKIQVPSSHLFIAQGITVLTHRLIRPVLQRHKWPHNSDLGVMAVFAISSSCLGN